LTTSPAHARLIVSHRGLLVARHASEDGVFKDIGCAKRLQLAIDVDSILALFGGA